MRSLIRMRVFGRFLGLQIITGSKSWPNQCDDEISARLKLCEHDNGSQMALWFSVSKMAVYQDPCLYPLNMPVMVMLQ